MKSYFVKPAILAVCVSLLHFSGCGPAQKPEVVTPPDDTPKSITPSETAKTGKPAVQARKAAASKKGGRLTADKLVYDFGDVEPLQRVKGQFLLTNKGTEILEIKKPIRKSCGCTVPKLKSYNIEPGKSTPLYVTYTVGSHPGKSTKTISIDTKSPGTPKTLMLKVTANIKKIVTVKPERFRFELQANSKHEYTVELESTDGKPFKITGLISRNEVVTGEFDAANEAVRHTVPIKIDVEKLRGTRNGVITFKINHPKLKNVSVQFQTVLPFVVHPSTKAFLRLRPGQPQTATVKVTSNFGEDFELGEISSAGGYIKVTNTTKTDDGYQIKFTFTVPPEEKKSIFHDSLLIHIKDQPQNTIKLSCYGRVSSAATRSARRKTTSTAK
jgi:Protein of unknown function (DUF1573)